MNDRQPVLTDALVERALARRAPRHADADLLATIVAEAGRTPQRRSVLRFPELLRPWGRLVLLSGALVLAAAVAIVGLIGAPPNHARVIAPTTPPATSARPGASGSTNGPIVVSPGIGFVAVDPITGATSVVHASGRTLAWSPDGTKLASVYGGFVWVADAATNTSTRVTPCCPGDVDDWTLDHNEVSWAPDGSHLAFADAGQIVTVAVDGSNRTTITHLGGSSIARQPAWSPNGLQIAFVLTTSRATIAQQMSIATMAPDGSGLRTLVAADQQTLLASPVWSPDGSRVAYLADGLVGALVSVMSADGSDRSVVFAVRDCCITNFGDVSWSPDGTRLATILKGSTGTGWSLYVMDPDGSHLVELTRNIYPGAPAWRPISVTTP